MRDIAYLELDEIAAPKLAVDREIEKGKISNTLGQLQSDPDRPDLSEFQWGFGPINRPLFHGLWLAPISALFVLLYMVYFLHSQWGNTSLAHHKYGALVDPNWTLPGWT